ncbi:hypothetical protein JX265_013605 [Neoarthrinium moseri]|uniref:Uncharacterized protein n=1 Tax=Neoarthrinium moseri TaxID=1658444 RepID=A0A9Q0AFR9_9PEZI|nr:hypothetical protein JX265_013605 [Neoarthrinium moseri]
MFGYQLVGRKQEAATPRWKPWTMRAPVLLAFIAASLVMAVVIEVLAQKSQRDGALARSPSIDDIPYLPKLASLYLPTVLAVLYGTFFAIIDHDIQRLQPWLELSKAEGATAEDSLLLDYHSVLAPMVPIKAVRQRHWLVLYTGAIMIIIFGAITPLQSSIFGARSTFLTQPTLLSSPSILVPIQEQASLLDASIIHQGFAITWLNQTYPSSMTSESAILPFYIVERPKFATSSVWQGWTWQLRTDLKCQPVSFKKGNKTNTFDSGRGCVVPAEVAGGGTRKSLMTIHYTSWYNNAYLTGYMESPTCSSDFKNQFILTTYLNYTSGDPSAQFCEPVYYKKNITVAISGKTLKPDLSTVKEVGPDVELTEEEFNRTAFGFLLGNGLPAARVLDPREYPATAPIDQWYQVMQRYGDFLSPSITNMVGFALGLGNYTAKQLEDPDTLVAAFSAAHKALFSIAISKLLINSTEHQMGTSTFDVSGILVSRPISAAVEGLLALIAGIAVLILIQCKKAQFKLSRDPNTLGRMMLIFRNHAAVLGQFSPLDQLSADGLRESIGWKRYRLYDCGDAIESIPDEEEGDLIHSKQRVLPRTVEYSQPKPLRLTELRFGTGVLIVTALAAGMAVLVYLKLQEGSLGGLPRPSEQFEVLQILENYIPTIYATALAPFWALLTRTFCFAQPFRMLQRGSPQTQSTIESKYTALLPQLNMGRAVRSKHYLLACLCSMTLLVDVFAVALGGVFNESTVQVQYPTVFSQERRLVPSRGTLIPDTRGSFVSSGYGDHFEVVFNNLSIHTDLPSWTSPTAYFLPFTENTSAYSSIDELRAITPGISVEPNCAVITTDLTSNPRVALTINATDQTLSLVSEVSGETKTCSLGGGLSTIGDASMASSTLDTAANSKIQAGLEVVQKLSNLIGQNGTFCPKRILAAWIRTNTTGADEVEQPVASTFILCRPTLQTAPYDVAVDTRGSVTYYRRIGGFEELMLSQSNGTWDLLDEVTSSITPLTSINGIFHDVKFSGDWINAYLSYVLNSTSHIDPLEPVPSADVMLPALEMVYRQLGAVMFGLNPSFWNTTLDGTTLVEGHLVRKEIRIFMSKEAFWVSVAILGTYIIVALFVYIKGLGVTFPRMPSTIGSVLAYVAASRAVREYEDPTTGHQKDGRARTYTFGKFIGCDGKPHVGIEVDPFVLPLKKESRRLVFHQKSQDDHPAWI